MGIEGASMQAAIAGLLRLMARNPELAAVSGPLADAAAIAAILIILESAGPYANAQHCGDPGSCAKKGHADCLQMSCTSTNPDGTPQCTMHGPCKIGPVAPPPPPYSLTDSFNGSP
jgi:hypothetical protein